MLKWFLAAKTVQSNSVPKIADIFLYKLTKQLSQRFLAVVWEIVNLNIPIFRENCGYIMVTLLRFSKRHVEI